MTIRLEFSVPLMEILQASFDPLIRVNPIMKPAVSRVALMKLNGKSRMNGIFKGEQK